MGNCIYYCDKNEELTYEKREHVFSAGLGGKRRLPQGYISDQANELFSKYEFLTMRYSPLQIARAKYGPGKRGSQNINCIDVPDVLSLKPFRGILDNDYVCPLGFIFQGQAYLLPQIIILFQEAPKDFIKIYLNPIYKVIETTDRSNFQQRIQEFLLSTKKNYRIIEVPHKTTRRFACIGFYKSCWYVCCTQPSFNLESCAMRVLTKKPSNDLPTDCFGIPPFTFEFKYSREIELKNMVPVFIHCKNCFNALAFFKGDKFVRQDIFDRFRQHILTNDSWDDVILPNNTIPLPISLWIKEHIHSHEHVVVIYTRNDSILAVSTLYGKQCGHFVLGTGYWGDAFSHAMICDFENQQEIPYDSGIPLI